MGGDGSGMATSIINGGGKDLTRTVGQIKAGTTETGDQTSSSGFAAEQAEAQKLEELKQNIEALIDGSELMKQFENQILLDITTEGLRIQIVDEQNRPMFDTGSAVLKPHMKSILINLTSTLNQVPNKLTLSGHTDATNYASGYKGYSNWELSTDRANACRREMVSHDLNDGKILRVVGLSSSISFNEVDAFAAVNRRISIVVMNKKTEDAVRNLSKNKTNDEKVVVDLPPIPKIGNLPVEAQSQLNN
jgi:chemotaxis protein MotB